MKQLHAHAILIALFFWGLLVVYQPLLGLLVFVAIPIASVLERFRASTKFLMLCIGLAIVTCFRHWWSATSSTEVSVSGEPSPWLQPALAVGVLVVIVVVGQATVQILYYIAIRHPRYDYSFELSEDRSASLPTYVTERLLSGWTLLSRRPLLLTCGVLAILAVGSVVRLRPYGFKSRFREHTPRFDPQLEAYQLKVARLRRTVETEVFSVPQSNLLYADSRARDAAAEYALHGGNTEATVAILRGRYLQRDRIAVGVAGHMAAIDERRLEELLEQGPPPSDFDPFDPEMLLADFKRDPYLLSKVEFRHLKKHSVSEWQRNPASISTGILLFQLQRYSVPPIIMPSIRQVREILFVAALLAVATWFIRRFRPVQSFQYFCDSSLSIGSAILYVVRSIIFSPRGSRRNRD